MIGLLVGWLSWKKQSQRVPDIDALRTSSADLPGIIIARRRVRLQGGAVAQRSATRRVIRHGVTAAQD